jgi:hypothetical protein
MRGFFSLQLSLTAVLLTTPAAIRAQGPLFVAAFAGGAFNTNDNSPAGNSGGFAYQTDIGLRLARVGFGAEVAQHNTGRDLKSKVYGGFVRLPSLIGQGPVRVYLIAGLGYYRFNPAGGKGSSTVGGSLGPGVSFGLRGIPLAVNLEARFHATFEKLPRLNNQQFVSVLAGLELDL